MTLNLFTVRTADDTDAGRYPLILSPKGDTYPVRLEDGEQSVKRVKGFGFGAYKSAGKQPQTLFVLKGIPLELSGHQSRRRDDM